MKDYIVRATAADDQIRAFAITSRGLVEEARTRHNTSPVATAALGRLLSAGAMMGAMMKGDQDLLTLQIKCSGPIQGLTVTADAKGNVKGFVENPEVMLPPNSKGKLDVGGALDLGILTSAARNYLDYGGLFIFDLNTEYKYKEILGEQTIAENREESSFIWENYFDEESHINEYNLTLFIKDHGDLFRKYEETHYQKAYPLDRIRILAERSGLELLHIYDAFTHKDPKADSERVYVVLRRPGQTEQEQ